MVWQCGLKVRVVLRLGLEWVGSMGLGLNGFGVKGEWLSF